MKSKLPTGVRDYEGEELELKNYLASNLMELYKFYSYTVIETPTFEKINVFASDSDFYKELYVLNNNNGDVLALKTDTTRSISRVVSEIKNPILPIRYCYNTKVFAKLGDLNGESHEITQCGLELIGVKNIKADVEAVKLAILSLKKLGLSNFSLHLCSNEFLDLFFDDFSLNAKEKETILNLIQKKNLIELEAFFNALKLDSKTREMLSKFLIVVGDISLLEEIKDLLKNYNCAKSLSYLETIYKGIGPLSKYVSFDFSIVTFDMYYTGIYFYACLENTGKEILKGGRYDNLILNQEFDKPLPAVGFAIELDYILKQTTNLVPLKKNSYFYFYGPVYSKAMEEEIKLLYKNGSVTITISDYIDLDSAKKYFDENKKYQVMVIYDEKGERSEVYKQC